MQGFNRLRILHVVPSLDPADGGPSVAVPLLARAIASRGHRVSLLTTVRGQQSDVGSERQVADEASGGVEYIYTRRNTEFYKVSWELVGWLKTNVKNFDVVHIHALFSFSSTAAAHFAARNGVPYIVRPLGVLNQWGLKNRRSILKRASLALIEKRIVTRAAAIHYTVAAEREEAERIGNWVAQLPSFVIPLPVQPRVIGDQLSVNGKNEEFLRKYSQTRGKRIVLFLSRIDRKKGIELLLEAFASIRKEIENVVLVIAGSGDPAYESSLRSRADLLGINELVVWTGFVSGDEKAAVLDAAEIFVLPSYSENFGIAAAEAFATGKACVLSDQVGLARDALQANAAIVTRCDAKELADAIKKLLDDSATRLAIGNAAREFARSYLSLAAIGTQLDQVYRAAIAAG
jgi:glycosyltransferase involved in cell wall biosynthesis